MLEKLRRGLEHLNKALDRGRTTRELTRCATINLRTAGAGFVTGVILASEGASSTLVISALGVSAVAIVIRTLQEAEAHFMKVNQR